MSLKITFNLLETCSCVYCKINNVFLIKERERERKRQGEWERESCNDPSLFPLFLSSYFLSRWVIFTHRAIHSRLTTGGVAIPPRFTSFSSSFSLCFFFRPSFSSRRSLSRDADILSAACRREIAVPLPCRQNGPAASRSVTSGFPNRGPAWRATSYRRPRLAREFRSEQKERREKAGEQRRCNFDG